MSASFDEAAFIPFASVVNDVDDLVRTMDQVEGLLRFLFRDKQGSITVKAGGYLSSNLGVIFKEIEDRGLEPTTDDRQAEFINAIIDYLKNIPIVKMRLAFDPNIGFVQSLNRKIGQLCAKKVILDITVDEKIIGGAGFEYMGKYVNYSLAKEIDEYLTKSPAIANFAK